MTIQQCKYVMKIAKAASFSEAAKQLFIAQSSLSISINQLEQELGIKIFEHFGNGVYLTNEGEEFVSYATRVSRNPLLKTEFEVWKIKAKQKLTAYRNGEISADEFRNWFLDDEWTRI